MRDPVIVGGRCHGKTLALRQTREICETVLRDMESRGRRFSAGVVTRAVRAALPHYYGPPAGIADAIEAEFNRSMVYPR